MTGLLIPHVSEFFQFELIVFPAVKTYNEYLVSHVQNVRLDGVDIDDLVVKKVIDLTTDILLSFKWEQQYVYHSVV